MRLASADICRLTGIPPNTLDRWVSDGLLRPAAAPGPGRGGVRRQYTAGDALAVAAGVAYRRAGAGPDRVAGVVKFLAGYGIERLEADLAAGRTFPVPAALLQRAAAPEGMPGELWLPGVMIAPPAWPTPGAAALARRLDLRAIYADVMRRIGELSRRPSRRERGRRGLEGATR
jgi:hypothetical protein